MDNIVYYILVALASLIALTLHEYSHGFASYKLGDPTARNLGRLTLNTIKHIDIFGFICMLIARIGWAKPVPINTRNFKNPRRDMALSSAAGPISNLILAVIHFILLRLVIFYMSVTMQGEMQNMLFAIYSYDVEVTMLANILAVIVYMLYIGIVLNISLAIFNLLPIPPFDGSRILYVFLPVNLYFGIMKYERYIQIGLLVLLWIGVLDGLCYNILSTNIRYGR